MIAYDRYLCVVKMEQITKRDSTLFTICLLITVWVVSIGKYYSHFSSLSYSRYE